MANLQERGLLPTHALHRRGRYEIHTPLRADLVASGRDAINRAVQRDAALVAAGGEFWDKTPDDLRAQFVELVAIEAEALVSTHAAEGIAWRLLWHLALDNPEVAALGAWDNPTAVEILQVYRKVVERIVSLPAEETGGQAYLDRVAAFVAQNLLMYALRDWGEAHGIDVTKSEARVSGPAVLKVAIGLVKDDQTLVGLFEERLNIDARRLLDDVSNRDFLLDVARSHILKAPPVRPEKPSRARIRPPQGIPLTSRLPTPAPLIAAARAPLRPDAWEDFRHRNPGEIGHFDAGGYPHRIREKKVTPETWFVYLQMPHERGIPRGALGVEEDLERLPVALAAAQSLLTDLDEDQFAVARLILYLAAKVGDHGRTVRLTEGDLLQGAGYYKAYKQFNLKARDALNRVRQVLAVIESLHLYRVRHLKNGHDERENRGRLFEFDWSGSVEQTSMLNDGSWNVTRINLKVGLGPWAEGLKHFGSLPKAILEYSPTRDELTARLALWAVMEQFRHYGVAPGLVTWEKIYGDIYPPSKLEAIRNGDRNLQNDERARALAALKTLQADGFALHYGNGYPESMKPRKAGEGPAPRGAHGRATEDWLGGRIAIVPPGTSVALPRPPAVRGKRLDPGLEEVLEGRDLRRLREAARLTQAAMAAEIGTRQPTLSRWESQTRGASQGLPAEKVRAIIAVVRRYGVNPEECLWGPEYSKVPE